MNDMITRLVCLGWEEVICDCPCLMIFEKRGWRVDVYSDGTYLTYRK